MYSRRKKREQRPAAVYQYDVLPKPLRVQVAYILQDAIGTGQHSSKEWWEHVHGSFAREKGLLSIGDAETDDLARCASYLLRAETDDALDYIENAFNFIHIIVRGWRNRIELEMMDLLSPDLAISELNRRFREYQLGYFFANGRIGRIDSEYLHIAAAQPALELLREHAGFAGPNQEFLAAHEFHRRGDQKEAIINAHKAFESTLKAICDARGWVYDHDKDTAKQLIRIVFDNGLIPDYLESQLAALRTMLETGVPTVRNRTAGHGQGAAPKEAPNRLAAYALHMTAANIVLLVESHKAKP